jgi:hypothetical protein
MIRKALIIIAAYALSAVGFVFMMVGAMSLVFNEDGILIVRLLPLVWVFAWTAHVRMSLAWARDLPVKRFWPVWGTVAGVVSLISPVIWIALAGMTEFMRHIEAALITTGLVSLYLSPSILLAIYLVRFHLRAARAVQHSSKHDLLSATS